MKFRTADARLLSHILLTKYGHSKSSHPTFSPYCVALTPSHQMGAMGLCLPLEHTRTFTAALTDKVWQKWCYQKMLWPPPFSLGSWNSATLLRRSPRSYTWSDNMEKIDVVSFPAFGPAGVTAESHPQPPDMWVKGSCNGSSPTCHVTSSNCVFPDEAWNTVEQRQAYFWPQKSWEHD